MRFVKISESQRKRLFEAYDGKFSFSDLDDYTIYDMYDYCERHLGKPFANGSSRVVFTLGDNIVLKLAYGKEEAGIEQNKMEFARYEKTKSKLFPIVYDHGENFEYIVSENVVPATYEDFEKILGIPWGDSFHQKTEKETDPWSKHKGDKEVGYDKYFDDLKDYKESWVLTNVHECLCYLENRLVFKTEPYDEELSTVIHEIPWLKEMSKLIYSEQIIDLENIDNFGLVNRDGNPSIVIIDSGFNKEIWSKYYR